jgi:phenylpropionate dioxygenase-like ring-hydroxylating dioxygenase large terminal subunit
VEEAQAIRKNTLYRTTVWGKSYVYWKDKQGFHALEDACGHRGASLSRGVLSPAGCVVCPYHGYEFTGDGLLTKVPGLPDLAPSPVRNQAGFAMKEHGGWVYLNTDGQASANSPIFSEPEMNDPAYARIMFNRIFRAPARIVAENSLDVMHIGFVHSFGNRERPRPIMETPPFAVEGSVPFHYRTSYTYETGERSIARKLYGNKRLYIENEFVLPQWTIARVIFGDLVGSVLTFATPLNATHSRIFVKTYRNYWVGRPGLGPGSFLNYLGDRATLAMMERTLEEDRAVVENIDPAAADGRYNMKYDKLQNVFRQFYRRLVDPITAAAANITATTAAAALRHELGQPPEN